MPPESFLKIANKIRSDDETKHMIIAPPPEIPKSGDPKLDALRQLSRDVTPGYNAQRDKILREGAAKLGVLEVAQDVEEIQQDAYYEFITNDSKTREMLDYAAFISTYDREPAIVYGETGTGKETVARIIHGKTTGKKFVAVNCTALTDNLLESELFGHKRGAFTGAHEDRTGKFLAAEDGTIFLDEIGDMKSNMQEKLLRVMQQRVVTPVGSNLEIPIRCRIVCATHRNLLLLVKQGMFREDLYWRLAVHILYIAPLRERLSDIEEIIQHHIKDWHELPEDWIDQWQGQQITGNTREVLALAKHTIAMARFRKHKQQTQR